MDRTREAHWQSAWRAEGIATARRDPAREKFFAIVAYPGTSGFLHVGHLRGMVYADALHRFHRLRGRSVFFPTGTHATGLPAVTFAQRVTDREPNLVAQLDERHVSEEERRTLEDPAAAARYLGRTYLDVFRRLGVLVDESAYVTTIDADYQAFIRWQFGRLARRGALVQAPHYAAVCPVCGPVSVDASETDLSAGGNAETVVFTTVPFRLDDGRFLLTATLRPETVYGATNVWIHPTEPLVHWHHGDATFLVGANAGTHLVEQHGGRVGHPLFPAELLGRTARSPLTDAPVPIVPSPLVDPDRGTGVVMSVPAHAPADWVAVHELDPEVRARIPPIRAILELPAADELPSSERSLLAGEGPPAERAARATGARGLADRSAVEEATERLYRLEHTRGRMTVGPLSGETVARARERTIVELKGQPGGFDFREFSEPVRCRNGHDVVIRRVPDQWFLHYADAAWKDRTRELVRQLSVRPAEYGDELPGIVDWFGDRPCTRRGRWLGTPFPLDPTWVIEPIADSTFYPAYFVVRRFVASGRLAESSLTDALFDFVFLGEGPGEPTVDRALLDELRAEFLYWYPLDLNIGGKEHKRVHFPVFLATHALLLPPDLQPRGLFVHWWLTEKGGAKVSKKAGGGKGGGIPPLDALFDDFGADALRLFNAQAASPHTDVEWDPDLVAGAKLRLGEIERIVRDASTSGGEGPRELDAWLLSAWHDLVRDATNAFESCEIRIASELVYARAPALIRRYLARGGSPSAALGTAVDAWLRLLVPITPHLAEELHAARGTGLVTSASWPDLSILPRHDAALEAEAYLDRVEEDLRSVARLAESRGERPTGVAFFIAAPWKATIERWIREAVAGGGAPPTIRTIMDRAAQHPELAAARDKIAAYVGRVAPAIRADPTHDGGTMDEGQVLRSAEGYLARKFGLERIGIHREDEGEAHDPLGRRDRSRPGRPAFYLSPTTGATGPRPTA